MIKSLLIASAMLLSVAAQAHSMVAEAIVRAELPTIQASVGTLGLDWKVGQENDYKLNMGGFLNGTMVMSVKSVGADGIWLTQDVDLMIQKQKVEILLDPSNGQIKKMLVNGQEQTPPKQDLEIIDQKEDHITVPAGAFDVIYLKVKDNASNGAISEMWVNPRDIPLSGMVKTIQDSQMGKVTIELSSFKK
ncbi:MAG: hypothetical protein ACXVAX_01975 [Pseudobdellovibrio sp.]